MKTSHGSLVRDYSMVEEVSCGGESDARAGRLFD
jgi:hypothetical protein